MPTLIYTIRRQPKTGLYSLRDGKAMLRGTFATFAEAEQEATELFRATLRRLASISR